MLTRVDAGPDCFFEEESEDLEQCYMCDGDGIDGTRQIALT